MAEQNTLSINTNKLFAANKPSQNYGYSKIRHNREYLLSQTVANEFNTYTSFKPFSVFTDAFPIDAKETDKINNVLGVRSLFNKHGGVILGEKCKDVKNASMWRISNNVPLIDTPGNRKSIKEKSGCSIKELVEASKQGILGKETYDYSDFMYCKHLGKMSNNYLITLRRFPTPVDDFISAIGIDETTPESERKFLQSQNPQSIGCLVTWLGTPGNEMSNILKYAVSMSFKEETAQWEDNNLDADTGPKGKLNSIAAIFDPVYRKQYSEGKAGEAANVILKKHFPDFGDPPYNVRDYDAWRDQKKVYGPIDAIKKTYVRDKDGLNFEQSISLTFDYELRSYNGINGRQAFLDLLSNILMVTYSTGTFWGGGYKNTGAHQNNIFTNMEVFKASGGVTDFINAMSKDLTKLGKASEKSFPKTAKEWGTTIKNAFNSLGGMLIGGMLNSFGRPHKVMLNSLLSPAPVGFWHVTVGNPHHPIMSMGNMILKNTTIEHYGPLGLDDFPTGIKVTCELTRGKPRDIRDIEKLYMAGNDRIFHGMGPKIFDMYKNSKEYVGNERSKYKFAEGDAEITLGVGEKQTTVAKIDNIKKMSGVLQKYFGHTDTQSIYIAAAEQEYGASKSSQQDYNNKNHNGKQT